MKESSIQKEYYSVDWNFVLGDTAALKGWPPTLTASVCRREKVNRNRNHSLQATPLTLSISFLEFEIVHHFNETSQNFIHFLFKLAVELFSFRN